MDIDDLHQDATTLADTKNKKPFLPPRWVIRLAWRIHRGLYRYSRGRFGLRRPKPGQYGLMGVTTVGRRTGKERMVVLAYLENGSDLTTMAMNGWGAPEPAWWLNMQANPECEIELPDGTRRFVGRAATGEDRDRLWAQWQDVDKNLDGYAALRPTETAVVVLEPVQSV